MANPTVSVTGVTSGLFLISIVDGSTYRVPKASVSAIADTSNSHAQRLEIMTNAYNIILIFDDETAKDAFITFMDSNY